MEPWKQKAIDAINNGDEKTATELIRLNEWTFRDWESVDCIFLSHGAFIECRLYLS